MIFLTFKIEKQSNYIKTNW